MRGKQWIGKKNSYLSVGILWKSYEKVKYGKNKGMSGNEMGEDIEAKEAKATRFKLEKRENMKDRSWWENMMKM